ncbi:MAG: phospho-sugar mutase [Mogibacterium sp.]|nr:phospho-sugar mutase [Mogibacterium sp.]
MEKYRQEYERWLSSDVVDEESKEELRALAGDEAQIEDRFDSMMTFGTAGLRGFMRAGLKGMNVYTVRYATQGFAEMILTCGEDSGGGVVIAHDCRNNSRLFAEEAACVMAANGIKTYIFDDLRPTPELSFAVRELGCIAGINITASHNPKEYNGYKAYWSDGAQLSPERASAVSAAIDRTDIFSGIKRIPFDEGVESGKIIIIGKEVDDKYISNVFAESIGEKYVKEVADDFSILYTPFHGCGYKMVPQILSMIGMKHVHTVPEQMVIDGNFPTVKSPNPENVEGFELAIKYAKELGDDLIIGTDPDSDRCGIAVRRGDEYVALSGNQLGCLLIDFIITVRREQGNLPADAAAIRSIVSTTMADRICEMNGVHIDATFTGFKYIGEKVSEYLDTGSHTFIFGFEESIGFLAGTYARDKDAVIASMLIAEMACWYKARGMNMAEGLEELYHKYGYYREKTISHYLVGFNPQQRMTKRMAEIRADLPTELGYPVIGVKDYLNDIETNMITGETKPIGLGQSDVLIFTLEGDGTCAIRPSGTEPKIKLYVMARGESVEDADAKVEKIIEKSLALLSV